MEAPCQYSLTLPCNLRQPCLWRYSDIRDLWVAIITSQFLKGTLAIYVFTCITHLTSHISSGKPYDADIDIRLEDWRSYLNYQHTGNQAKATVALNNIITYSNNINNAGNVNTSNTIISLWAFNKLNKQAAGTTWINTAT